MLDHFLGLFAIESVNPTNRNHQHIHLANRFHLFGREFVTEIPKTAVGKFDKKVLRARLADGDLEVERVSS